VVSPNSSGNQDLVDICSYGIINGRGFTAEEKQRLVAASYTSDVSVREFATRHGIGYSTLNKWRRQYGRSADSSPGFVPVALTGRQDVPDRSSDRQEDISLPEPVDEAGIARIVIALPNCDRNKTRTSIRQLTIPPTPFVQRAVTDPFLSGKVPHRQAGGKTRRNKTLLFLCRKTAPVDNAITTYVDQILISRAVRSKAPSSLPKSALLLSSAR